MRDQGMTSLRVLSKLAALEEYSLKLNLTRLLDLTCAPVSVVSRHNRLVSATAFVQHPE